MPTLTFPPRSGRCESTAGSARTRSDARCHSGDGVSRSYALITAADRATLLAKGVAAAFGPGALPEDIIATMRRLVAAGVAPPP